MISFSTWRHGAAFAEALAAKGSTEEHGGSFASEPWALRPELLNRNALRMIFLTEQNRKLISIIRGNIHNFGVSEADDNPTRQPDNKT